MHIFDNGHFRLLYRGQKLFLETWFNLTHERSLDSFRVRCHNGRTILEELRRESGFEIASTEDIATIAEETREICKADTTLKTLLGQSWHTLITLLDSLASKKTDADSSRERKQLDYVLSDILPSLGERYLAEIVKALEIAIADTHESEIIRLANCLATEMAARGSALSGMHIWVEAHFLNGPWDDEQFPKRFAAFVDRLKLAPREYNVTLILSGNRELPKLGHFGDFKFSENPPVISAEALKEIPYIEKLIRRNKLRAFASISVEAVDQRSAVLMAQEKFAACLDRLRFNFAREPVVAGKVVIVYRPEDGRLGIRQVDAKIPSPDHHLPLSEFLLANKKIDDLIKSGQLPNESRRRIEAAVRHYRLGMDAHAYRDKLLNWWMGLETLTNAGDGKGIGARVFKNSLPLITHRYFEVQICLLFDVIGKTCPEWTPRVLEILGTAAPKHISLEQKLAVLQDAAAQTEIATALDSKPWIQSRWHRYVELAADQQKLAQHLREHDQRVRWHLLRLYRIRCCLVHGTPVEVPLQLPSANLEFYLREAIYVTIDSLLQASHIPSLDVVFERASLCAGIRKEILAQKGSPKTVILNALSTGIIFRLAK